MQTTYLADETRAQDREEVRARKTTQDKEHMERYAFLQFIIRRRIRCPEVFAFPFVIAAVHAGLFVYCVESIQREEWVPPAWLMASILLVVVMLIVWITAFEAKTVTIQAMLKLEKVPQSEWFTIAGIEQTQDADYPLTLTLVDPFGKISRITAGCDTEKYESGDEVYQLGWFIVHCLKPKWEPLLKAVRKQGERSQV